MNFSINNLFNKPTPVKIMRWSHALIASSTFITSSSLIADWKMIALFAVLGGALGHALLNCIAEDEKDV